MLFRSDLAQSILDGTKTQTRRVKKPGETLWVSYLQDGKGTVTDAQGRIKWDTNRTYAVQTKRGDRAIGRFTLLGIKVERIDMISETDARAEGFRDREAFWDAFQRINPGASLDAEVFVLTFELI